MKKHFLSFFLILFAVSSYAGTVSVSDAQNVALNFFKANTNTSVTLTATLVYTKTGTNNVADLYVFNISPVTGFVIISGNDKVAPILAYSTESSFRADFSHTGLNDWVNQTSAKIELAVVHNLTVAPQIQTLWLAYRSGLNPNNLRSAGSIVGPLCSTTWDQENDISNPPPFIYNLFCPYNATDMQRALTGCVATAQAQIMKYWNYPAVGTGSFSYVDDTTYGYSFEYGTQSSDFAAHTYQWDSMPSVLTDSTTGAQDSAVDRLMYDCAVSVGMDFGDDNQDGSGANALLSEELTNYGDSLCSQTALIWYFGYDPDTMQGIYRFSYSDSAWIAVIEHEINVGRPVLYEGVDTNPITGGGHAWVCDGYGPNPNPPGRDFLHMNWGWGGYANGLFSVDSFTTGYPGNYFNPVSQNDALIGIMPRVYPAGINSLSQAASFKVYPNPASNDVVILTSDNNNSSTWEFKNIVGQTVINGSIDGTQTHVSTAGLASGVYFVIINDGGKTMVNKLVISKQ